MTDAFGGLPRGGFVKACRAAMVAGDLEVLQAHAVGRSAEVAELMEIFGTGRDPLDTGQRAMAIAWLALALAPQRADRHRAADLSAAIELWTPAAGSAIVETSELSSPAEVVDTLRLRCEDNRGARLTVLHDIAMELRGEKVVQRRHAATRVPVTLHGAGANRPSMVVLLRVRCVNGLLPGVYEAAESAFARRGLLWRAAEKDVSDVIARTDPAAALRYTVWEADEDDGSDSYNALYLDELNARSAGLALAVACRYAVRRGGRPIGRDVVISAAIDASGAIGGVGRLDRKAKAIPRRPRRLLALWRWAKAIPPRPTRLLVESSQQPALVMSDEVEQIGLVPKHVKPIGVKTLDEAVRAARQRVSVPLALTAAALLLGVMILVSLMQAGQRAEDRRSDLERALPGKVDAEVRRLEAANPDLVPLVHAVHALVQPSLRTAQELLSSYLTTAETTLRPRTGGVLEVNFMPGTPYVLTGGRNGTVTSWNARTGARLATLDVARPFAEVVGIEPARGGRLFAATGRAGTLTVGEIAADGTLKTVARHDLDLAVDTVAAQFSPNASSLAVVTAEGNLGFLDGPEFDRVEWKQVGTTFIEYVVRATEAGAIICEDFDEPGARVLRVSRPTGGATEITNRDGSSLGCPVWLGKGLYAASYDDQHGIEIGRIRGAHWQPLQRRALGGRMDDYDRVDVPGLVRAALKDRTVVIDSRARIHTTVPVPGEQFSTALSVRLQTLALNRTGSDVTLIPFSGTGPERLLPTANVGATSLGLALSADASKLAVGLANGNVAIVDPGGLDRKTDVVVTPLAGEVRAVAFDQNARMLWVGAGGSLLRVDLARDEVAARRDLGGTIRNIALTPDGRRIAVAGFRPTGIVVLDATSLAVLEQDEETEAAAVHWLGSGRLLVATGAGANGVDTPRIEVRDGELQTRAPAIDVDHGAGYLGFAAHPANPSRVLAFGGDVTVLEAAGFTPRILRSERVDGAEVPSAAWSSDGRLVALAGDDEIDIREASLLRSIGALPVEGEVTSLLGHEGVVALTVHKGTTVRLTPFGVRAWSQKICDRTRLFLGPAQWTRFAGNYPAYRTPCRPSPG